MLLQFPCFEFLPIQNSFPRILKRNVFIALKHQVIINQRSLLIGRRVHYLVRSEVKFAVRTDSYLFFSGAFLLVLSFRHSLYIFKTLGILLCVMKNLTAHSVSFIKKNQKVMLSHVQLRVRQPKNKNMIIAHQDIKPPSLIIIVKVMVKTWLLILHLALISNSRAEQPVVFNQSSTPNFQGSFDSMEPPHRQQPSGQNLQLSPKEAFQHEQQDILEFTQNLGDFTPDQTFTIRMQPYSKASFFLHPSAQIQSFRGMFHSQISWNVHQTFQTGKYLDLTIMDQASVVRQYKHQRLGVFNQPHSLKDHRYFFHLSSHQAPIDIYFSYELIAGNKKKIANQSNETELSKVSKSFAKVNRILDQQQREMIRLIDIGDRHAYGIKAHLQQLYLRGIAEGLFLILSALASLWMLKRQIYSQYQSLV